ncbi:MAG: Fe-S cluster assembly scaffold protein NifU [Clostridia bacterium]|nr:Fe-S cluster assembly scaffold protein NifU [Clostridia bacterium]MDY5263493.1 Fe-S cluster assembly scaffold protein NifU [Eubacteriales bacterium]
MYNDKVMDNFKNPRNVGVIENADGESKVGSPECGDIMQIFLKINDDEVIEDAKFQTFGCAAAVASSSMATQMLIGKTIKEALKLTNRQVVEELEGLPPQKIHCSVLAEDAIHAAVRDYLEKKGKDIKDYLD